MRIIKTTILSVGFSLCIAGCNNFNVNNSGGQPAAGQENNQLLTEIPGESAVTSGSDSKVLRQRTVKLNQDILLTRSRSVEGQPTPDIQTQRPFSMRLFDDANFIAVVDSYELISPNSKTWSGHFQNVEGTFSIVLDADGILGTVRVPDKGNFRILTVGGKTVAQELDPTKFNQPGDPVRPSVKAEDPGRPRATATPDDGSITDILVLYTPAARDAAGTTAEIERIIVASILETNNAYARSLVLTKLNLTYKGLAAYNGDKDGKGSMSVILSDLMTKGDGKLDEAHSLRDSNKADLVMLLVADNDEGGRAYMMDNKTNNAAFEKFAFGVVQWNGAVAVLNFSHEVGHNQGCAHDRENATSQGVYNYSYGYRFVCLTKTYRTIMSYQPGIQIPYFSNPAVNFPGTCATGLAEGDPKACEEAKTINNTRKLVANFRPRTP